MCTGEESTQLLPLPYPYPPRSLLTVFPPSSRPRYTHCCVPHHLFLLALETSERTHGASRAYFSVHTIIVERARRWYREYAGPVRPLYGKRPYFSPLVVPQQPTLLLVLHVSFAGRCDGPRRRWFSSDATSDINAFSFRSMDFLLLFPA